MSAARLNLVYRLLSRSHAAFRLLSPGKGCSDATEHKNLNFSVEHLNLSTRKYRDQPDNCSC